MRKAWNKPIAIGACTAIAWLLAACAPIASKAPLPPAPAAAPHGASERQLQLLNRLTWGANASAMQEMKALGTERFLARQLHPAAALLPAEIQAQIDAMSISQRPRAQIAFELERRRKEMSAADDLERKKAEQQSLRQEMNRLAREAAARSLLRSLYSPNQLQEQLTWFWMNHFNVFQYKSQIRALIGDYEERAIRAHALGRFRDLLAATVFHPAMPLYLDDARNAAGRINENCARELMELHTLGVDGGYTQRDVQELARMLTGFGVNLTPNQAQVRPALRSQYVRDGLFEFNPNRHDYGDKEFLGQTVRGRGLPEIEETIDRLARHPATARFISRKLAVHFAADNPSRELIERMARTFQASDGDIAATLTTLLPLIERCRSMNRREMLQLALAAPLAAASPHLYAAPSAGATLLVVFLRGGYDAANFLVPIASDFYLEARPNIALLRPGQAADAALQLDSDWGLHPALRDTLFALYRKGEAAFVPFAGSDDLTRSHFETQDAIELGWASGASRDYGSGFLNRLVALITGARPLAFTKRLPTAFRGKVLVPKLALDSIAKHGVDSRQSGVIASMYRQTALESRLPGAHRIPRTIRRAVCAHLRPEIIPTRHRIRGGSDQRSRPHLTGASPRHHGVPLPG